MVLTKFSDKNEVKLKLKYKISVKNSKSLKKIYVFFKSKTT